MLLVRWKVLLSHDKAIVKAILQEVNSKITDREGSSASKPLLTNEYSLMGKI